MTKGSDAGGALTSVDVTTAPTPTDATQSSPISIDVIDAGGVAESASVHSDTSSDGTTTGQAIDASTVDDGGGTDPSSGETGVTSEPTTTDPVLVSVVVVLSASTLATLEDRATFEVLCAYDNDGPEPCTDKASIDVSAPDVASLNIETGEFSAITNGSTAIVASVDGVTSEPATLTVDLGPICDALRVTGPTSAAAGTSLTWAATCDFDDGRTDVDVSDSVAWTSNADSVAQVSAGGTIAAAQVGSALITASLPNPDASIASVERNFTVTNGVLVAVTISATNGTSVPEGMTTGFSAECEYSDVTTDCTAGVTWLSSSPTIATAASDGIATGHTMGTTNLSASLGTVVSNEVLLTVTAPVVVDILLNPSAGVTLEVNTERQLTATCILSNATSSDCTGQATWLSSSPLVAAVDERGMLFGQSDGPSLVSATRGEVVSTPVTVTVVPPDGCEDAIEFPDEVMLLDVRSHTGKAAGAIYYEDVKSITQFEHSQSNGFLEFLDGLECFTSLQSLTVERAWLADLSPIVGLVHLESLRVGFTSVDTLPDVSHLTALSVVDLANTEVTSLYSLVVAEHFAAGDSVNVVGSPIDCSPDWGLAQIQELEARGVVVAHSCE